jgi:hypothetical protein
MLHGDDAPDTPTRVKAALVDPVTLAVVWASEPISSDASSQDRGSERVIPIEHVVPMAAALGLQDVLRIAADTGVAQHLEADLVSTGRGSMVMVVSVHRMPDGMLLVLAENTWRPGRGKAAGSEGAQRPSRRRTRGL